MFFVSKPTDNTICGPLLFYYELAPLMVRVCLTLNRRIFEEDDLLIIRDLWPDIAVQWRESFHAKQSRILSSVDSIQVYNGYIFGIPLIAVLLNSVTAAYLLYKRYTAGINRTKRTSTHILFTEAYVKNSHRTVNELFIAAALLMQSVIPALTMSSKGYRSMQEIYG